MEFTPIERMALTVEPSTVMSLCRSIGLDEHPLFSRAMWLAVVNAGQTDEGYWDWARHMHTQTQNEMHNEVKVTKTGRMVGKGVSLQAIPKLSPAAVHVPQAPVTTIDLAHLVQNWSQGDPDES